MRILGWGVFVLVQLVAFAAFLLGIVLLILPCLLRAWKPVQSTLDSTRTIDVWTWPINFVYGNFEDGVSGQYALVWNDSGQRVPYMADAHPAWRAYCWSAWRNSANGLKYLFRWMHGPFYRWENAKHTAYFQAGWNTRGLPTLSAGRM